MTPKVHRRYRKISFGEKRPLNVKFSKFRYERIHRTWIQVFLPSFAEIGIAKVTKRVGSIHHEIKVGILPLPLERSRQKFCTIILSRIPHASAKFCPNPSSFRGDIQKCLPGSLQYRRKACRLLADNHRTVLSYPIRHILGVFEIFSANWRNAVALKYIGLYWLYIYKVKILRITFISKQARLLRYTCQERRARIPIAHLMQGVDFSTSR